MFDSKPDYSVQITEQPSQGEMDGFLFLELHLILSVVKTVYGLSASK